MQLIRSLLNFAALLAGCFWTVLVAPVVIAIAPFNQPATHSLQRLWARGWLWLLDIEVTILGLENLPTKACVIIANHSSGFDIMVLDLLPVDFKWLAKVGVGKIPFIGQSMRAMGCYFVTRTRSEHDINVMHEVEEGLRNGISVTFFPEGTRTRTGEMLPFKKGAFRIAQNTGNPIVPVGLNGTFQIAPKGAIPKHRGHKVTMKIGKPFTISKQDDLNVVIENSRKTIEGLRK